MVQSTARAFAERVLAPRAAERDRTGTFPVEELAELGRMGLLGVNVPAELGGAEAGTIAYSLAMEAVAGGCASTSVAMAVTNMVAEVIVKYAADEVCRGGVARRTTGGAIAGRVRV